MKKTKSIADRHPLDALTPWERRLIYHIIQRDVLERHLVTTTIHGTVDYLGDDTRAALWKLTDWLAPCQTATRPIKPSTTKNKNKGTKS